MKIKIIYDQDYLISLISFENRTLNLGYVHRMFLFWMLQLVKTTIYYCINNLKFSIFTEINVKHKSWRRRRLLQGNFFLSLKYDFHKNLMSTHYDIFLNLHCMDFYN